MARKRGKRRWRTVPEVERLWQRQTWPTLPKPGLKEKVQEEERSDATFHKRNLRIIAARYLYKYKEVKLLVRQNYSSINL